MFAMVASACKQKEEGNECYKDTQYAQALSHYSVRVHQICMPVCVKFDSCVCGLIFLSHYAKSCRAVC